MASFYEVLGPDGTILKKVLAGNSVTGIDVVPATQVARGDGAIINPATSDLQAQILSAFAALVTEAGLEAALAGKATASKQDTGNTSLGGILAALAAPLTVQGSVTVSDGAGPLTVDATSLPLPTGAATDTKLEAVRALLAAALTINLPTGASTSALQTSGNTALATIASALAGTLTVQGAVTVSDGAGPLSVDGTVSVGNFPATQAVSATVLPLPTGAATAAKQPALGTAGAASSDVLTIQGSPNGVPQPVTVALPSTSAPTNVTAAAAATPILAANATRKRFSIFNDSTAVAYVLEGTGTVSATNYSFQVAASGYYTTTDWAGAVSAIWASANGAARVTEYAA